MSKKEKLKAALKKNKEVKVSAKLAAKVEEEIQQEDPKDAEQLIQANEKNIGPAESKPTETL